jgi:hypothetical protein
MAAARGLACWAIKTIDEAKSKETAINIIDEANSKQTLLQQTWPLREYLTRVQLSVRAKVCDEELTKKLFCIDVQRISAVDNKEAPNEKRQISLSKECVGYKPPPE